MPRISTRQTLLTKVNNLARSQQQLLLSVDGDEDDYEETLEDLEDILLLRYFIQKRRYLVPRIYNIQRRTPLLDWFESLNKPRAFRLCMRMSASSFLALVALIDHHPVFQSTGRKPQAPVRLQLAVFLYRLGMSGAGSSLAHTSLSLGLSEGSVQLYTLCTIEALQQIKQRWICWPGQTARTAHAHHIAKLSGSIFQNCVGFIDGTFINLQFTPEVDHSSYFNRKSTYALNAMVICNDDRRILYLRAGDTSAVHDTRVFSCSFFGQNQSRYLTGREYLLGDSAYTPTARMITPFKKPRARQRACRHFNYALSQRRIVIEHTFGMIKARFPALTHIPVRIRDQRTHGLVVQWFESGCILHNFLLARKDEVKWLEKETDWSRILEEIQADNEEFDNNIGGISLRDIAEEENEKVRERIFERFKRLRGFE